MRPPDPTSAHPAVLGVAEQANNTRAAAEQRLASHGIGMDRVRQAIRDMRSIGRVTLNFHPDRRDSTGRTVAAGLLADGEYKSQFATGISNGQRFAGPGGARTRWEQQLFGSLYGATSIGRPVYGALDLFNDPYGGAPRFGSSFVVLAPHCFDRATLCVGDSHLAPVDLGTSTTLTSILAGAVESCSPGDGFGRGLSPASFLDALGDTTVQYASVRELDRYIEAQVHGGIELTHDVATIMLDPSFRETTVERNIREAGTRYEFEVQWNEGSEVDPALIDPGFRGSDIQQLALETTRADGLVDAATIGQALDLLPYTQPLLAGDPEESPLQRYKKLWHCCLRFGEPARQQ